MAATIVILQKNKRKNCQNDFKYCDIDRYTYTYILFVVIKRNFEKKTANLQRNNAEFMAHLLGSQNCLESLAVDIGDVHDTITDIFARVGPVRYPSWKYPDKASCDLDINKLLSRYSYSKDEDHAKLSHIILFELLIDRY